MDIEIVLKKINLCSSFYVKLFSLLMFAAVMNSMYGLQYAFVVGDSKYRCKNSNCSGEKNVNISVDVRCYSIPVSDKNTFCGSSDVDRSAYIECTEWIYEDGDSFFAEFNLGCQDWKKPFVGTVHLFGYMIGLLIMGPLSDKFGRKKLIIFTGLLAAITGIARSLVFSYWTFVSLELIEAMLADTYSSTFMLGVEMVTKDNRAIFITLMTVSLSLGGILMALIAWAVPYWRHFLRIIYAPSLVILLYVFLLDESLRWLLITGRKTKAKNILERAVTLNDKDDTKADIDNICCDKGVPGIRLKEVLKTTLSSRKLVIRTLGCVFMWMCVLFNKYAILLNSVELEGDKYINFSLVQFTELPASIVLVFVLRRFRRKLPLIFSFILSGLFCVTTAFVPKDQIVFSTCFFLLGKFMATISYAIVYLYTAELFPTHSRNTMHSLCSSLGRITVVMAPYTPYLMRYWYGLPSLLIGILSLVAGFIVMLMPDTAEDVLPDTVTEAENIGSKGAVKDVEVTKF